MKVLSNLAKIRPEVLTVMQDKKFNSKSIQYWLIHEYFPMKFIDKTMTVVKPAAEEESKLIKLGDLDKEVNFAVSSFAE